MTEDFRTNERHYFFKKPRETQAEQLKRNSRLESITETAEH